MRSSLVALALAAALAAGRPSLDAIWTLLASAWSASSMDEGCIFDPDGRCNPAPRNDAGCGFDPNGRCNPAPQTDEGLGFDPDG